MRAVDLSDPSQVSPGIAGFLTVFLLAVATWLLIRSMVGHLRKVRFRAEQESAEKAAAEAAAQKAASKDVAAAQRPAGAGPRGKGSRPARRPGQSGS